MSAFEEQVKEVFAGSSSRLQKARLLAQLVQRERNYHWVGLYDVSKTQISAIAWTGESAPAFPTFPITKGINGAAVAARQSVVVQDVSKDSRYLTTFGQTKAEAIFPIFSSDGVVVGTIDVESERVNAFGPEDGAFLNQCALLLRPLWKAEQADQTDRA
jgi:putative methionine-R-sulfoxide reductase with GAF domain